MKVDTDRRKVLRLFAAVPVMPGAVGAVLASCSSKKNEAGAAEEGEVAKPFGGGEPVVIPWKGRFRHFGLIENLSFASLLNEGLLIDFGTTDYFKYTLGGWRTGWGRSFVRDGVAYTHVTGVTTRVYFHRASAEDLVVRFRAKPLGGKHFSLYMNNKPIQRVDLTKPDWHTYSVKIPSGQVRKGENYMLLRWNGTAKVAGEDLAAGMDYIHIVSAARADDGGVLPTHSAVAGKARAGGDEAPALLLAAGMTLTYWMWVPDEESLLGFNVGLVGKSPADMSLKVTAHTDGASPAEIVSRTVKAAEAGGFHPASADLAPFRGKVVKLDIEAFSTTASNARLALVEPGLYVKAKGQPVKPAKKAKNVIMVMVDTLRADHTSPYAKTRVKTPVFDRFAREGVLYERFSAVEDWTKPSCATMLTGLYPATHKTQTDGVKLPSKVRMISQELKARGVTTGAFIANGDVSGKFGFDKGWDQYTNYIREGKVTDAKHVFADAASWIEANKDKRFFTYVHTIDPHVPYSPPKEFLAMYDDDEYSGPVKQRNTHLLLEDIKKDKFTPTERDKRRIEALYDGEISYHDKWFGGFLQKLNDLELLEDTLIMVVSDHGEEFWEHGGVGHGHQLHQEMIHVPFVAMWQDTLPAHVRVPENEDHTCMAPTIYDAMQIAPPKYLEAKSILPRMMGRQEPGPHAGFSTHQNDRQAVWSERWKLLMRGPVKTYLYDIEKDYGCTKDLDEDKPLTLTYMRALLGQFMGAPDKSRWRSRTLAHKPELEVKEEQVEMDDELKQQLEALGYVK
ncbi:MAG: sulfatase [Deltaproteobacteria bacterium]|nr:sulfatase [Deltaproteobacteria bacterium]